jgi:hypothetical protein
MPEGDAEPQDIAAPAIQGITPMKRISKDQQGPGSCDLNVFPDYTIRLSEVYRSSEDALPLKERRWFPKCQHYRIILSVL